MPAVRCTQIEVYVFRRARRRVEFLALRRSPHRLRLPGVWQPVTGGIVADEPALRAAVREVREETGLCPRRWWTLEAPTVYLDAAADAVEVVPVFAAEIGAGDRVARSAEHDAHRFLPARAAGKLFLWEAQRRALEAVRREVLRGGPLAAALEVTPGNSP